VVGVEGAHRAEVEAGEHIAVDDEQRGLGAVHQAERARGAERAVLVEVADADAERRAVAEVALDMLGLVPRRDDDIADARVAEVADRALEQGLARDGEHGLGGVLGERAEARAEPARHDDRGQRVVARPLRDEVREADQVDDAVGVVEQREVADLAVAHHPQHLLGARGRGEPDGLGIDRVGLAGEELPDRAVEGVPREDRPADVAVRQRAQQPPGVVGDHQDADPPPVERAHGVAHRRGLGQASPAQWAPGRRAVERSGVHPELHLIGGVMADARCRYIGGSGGLDRSNRRRRGPFGASGGFPRLWAGAIFLHRRGIRARKRWYGD
jgi:hypothetical protein